MKTQGPFSLLLLPLVVVACFSACDDSTPTTTPKPPYALPSRITLDFSAERGPSGEVYIVGSTNLPEWTKLGAEVTEPGGGEAQDYDIFVSSGRFRSTGFTNDNRPIPSGKRKVHVLAYFNGAWQTSDILRLVGEGGTKLNGPVIKPQDPDVIDSDKLLDVTKVLVIPPIAGAANQHSTADENAIDFVKRSTLTVDGSRSASNIGDTVEFFMYKNGVRPGNGWSLRPGDGGKVLVSYDFIDGADGQQQAVWELDPKTHNVRYVNKRAKLMSWLPKD